jgi:hypothetical protein
MAVPLRERQEGDRRAHARGGRRVTDQPSSVVKAPCCPLCGEIAKEVGESDGGWWLVCDGCDHLWNERDRCRSRPIHHVPFPTTYKVRYHRSMACIHER